MFVVTFYSYKGGVGRTSALVNVAYRLARGGKRVFVIDFDLEAPGIDAYGLAKADGNAPGLVEYISAFTATGKVPSLVDFVQHSTLQGTSGKLFFMPGGKKDDAYKSALGQLDWKVLYKERKGFLLVENLKAAILELFKPDYLLVDARTGLTDVSGICTLQLPDLVVLLFSLNEQNITGVSTVLRSIKRNQLNREIGTLLVASPVPDMPEWVEARTTRFEAARAAMGSAADVVLPYEPFLAFRESIVEGQSKGQSASHLGKAYDSLTRKIISGNASDVVTLLDRATQLRNEGQPELAEAHFRGIVDALPESTEAWMEFGRFEKLLGKLVPACECFERAYSLEPANCEVLAQLCSTYAYVDKSRCERYFHELLKLDQDPMRIMGVSGVLRNVGLANLALEGFMQAVALDDKKLDSFFELGQTNMLLRHYRQAVDAYRRALELDPNHMASAYNLAMAYQKLDDPRASEYYVKAIEIFEQTKPRPEKTHLANVNEAMSRAYLALGNVKRASELLGDALVLAKELPKARFFSSSKYQYISQGEFVTDVEGRLHSVQQRLAANPVAINEHREEQTE
jgi:tetratricopeptide (TPR) repeat protein